MVAATDRQYLQLGMKLPPEVPARPPAGDSALHGWHMSRRRFLGLSLATAAAATSVRLLWDSGTPSRFTLGWVSPEVTLTSVNDYPLWVALDLGYMRDLGVDLHLLSATDAALMTRWRSEASVSFPSPAALVSAADRGIGTRAVFQLCSGSIFGFAFPTHGSRHRAQQLAGAVISVGDASWRQIVDPLLVEAGVDPRSVTTLAAGDHWLKLAQTKAVDAALSWRGLEQTPQGSGLDHRVGGKWSNLPGNAYAVDSPDHAEGAVIDGLTRFLKGTVMGLEFTEQNPRAAAQIVHRSVPGLAAAMTPQQTVDAIALTSSIYSDGKRRGLPWGYHEPARWQRYVEVAEQAGMLKSIDPRNLYTNRLITEANSIDRTRVNLDAVMFGLDHGFRVTTSPTGG